MIHAVPIRLRLFLPITRGNETWFRNSKEMNILVSFKLVYRGIQRQNKALLIVNALKKQGDQ